MGYTGYVGASFDNGFSTLQHIARELDLGKAVTVVIHGPDKGVPLLDKHAYIVERVNYMTFGKLRLPVSVVLRNPWGHDGAGNDGNKYDALVTVTGEQLVRSMEDSKAIQSAWV